MPERIQRQRCRGWRMPAGAIYVGRPSRWRNPFHVSLDRQVVGADGREITVDGLLCLAPDPRRPPRAFLRAAFAAWIERPEQAELLAQARAFLRGHALACWCPLDAPCHAEIWLALCNEGVCHHAP